MPAADELPWTISYVIRKRSQIDSFNELPSEKRPPDDYIWYRPPEDIERWLDRVFDRKSTGSIDEAVFEINESEIE